MPALNFKQRFVEKIQRGTKSHTIRAKRKRPIKVGDKLFLYTGLRHKGAARILPDAQRCSQVQDILITTAPDIYLDGQQLALDECHRLARADGFTNFADMIRFWEGKLPFHGDIIHWREV